MMKRQIIGGNGLSYTLADDGMYYPDIMIPVKTDFEIGKYGIMRFVYLEENKYFFWLDLLVTGRMNQYLHDIDVECDEMMDIVIDKMMKKQEVTEKLKADDQMKWVGMVNNIRQQAEEIVIKELVLA